MRDDFLDSDLLVKNSVWINKHFSELCVTAAMDYIILVSKYCNDIHEIDKRIKPCNQHDPESIMISFEQIVENMKFLLLVYGSEVLMLTSKLASDLNDFVALNSMWERGGKFVVRL